jgi:AraC-like DNA-binding protein
MCASKVKPLYTVKELADLAGCHPKTMARRLRKMGVALCFRLVPLSELMAREPILAESLVSAQRAA